MLDPILNLAISMHSGKGVYALLLGSGVSRASVIPTGWEVVVDLIRKLAHMKGENCDPDPEAWYKALTGSVPDYSDILDRLTKSSADRGLLLRSYFEPTPQDREQGRKIPSPAHHAIATLVTKGYVRVIVTTNFDRLTEQALSEVGVQPTVINTTDAVKGALPLVHSPCSIIKVHGDYLDARIKNTRLELASYDKPIDDLLDRVFDEYGLVVCGWSAEWDVALRAAMERCNAHRFGTYWTAYRGEIGPHAERLIAQRRATPVPITDADAFFRELAEKISALEDITLSDPISAKVAVARMKRYLARPEERINLHDLVNAETERVHAFIAANSFPKSSTEINGKATLQYLRACENTANVLVHVLACGAYWASRSQSDVFCRSVKRLADGYGDGNSWLGLKLRGYPALLAFYSTGLVSVAKGDYRMLERLLAMTIRVERNKREESVTVSLTPFTLLRRDLQQVLLPGRERDFTPLSNHVFEVLREPVRDYLPDDREYDQAFDWFEYLSALVHCDRTITPEQIETANSGATDWCLSGPIGRFLWNRRDSDDNILARTNVGGSEAYPAIVTDILRAGFFRSVGNSLNWDHFQLIKQAFDRFVSATRNAGGVY